ncbi:zinc finger protein 43-like [Homalodisca vitripennis]|uniref:zinc finger protein 43-like n=1 Tax=Homalodisca vitripennis TaxID=197043 RepID=UPI001EEB37BD|nr:zinc finger protein 43-like [Homalodisca vitripennis]KAG8318073.1 hypothetical protein J6590_009950 [Homalodisca vitripennis]
MAPETLINSLLDLKNMCRLCLSQNTSLYLIFADSTTADSSLVSMTSRIKACVDIEVTPRDDLPNKICHRCKEQLENWVKFKELCDNANTLLLQCAAGGIQSLSDGILEKNSQNSASTCLDLPETSSDFSFVDSLLEHDSLFQKLEDAQHECLQSNKPLSDSNPTLHKDDYISTHDDPTNKSEKELKIQNEEAAQKVLSKLNFRKKYFNFYSKKYKCDICGTVFTKYSSLLHHDKVDHKNMIPEEMCGICGKLFVTKIRLYMHKHLKHKVKMYECEICGMKSVSKKSLKVHKVRHSLRFVCNVCNFVASTNRSLQDHLNTHKTERMYRCELCHGTFKQQQALEHHLKTHDDDSVLRAKCDVCSKKFRTYDVLRKHKISHVTEVSGELKTAFICEICGKILKTKQSLYIHKSSHSEKHHMCTVCDELFSTKNLLKRHMVVHGERLFACTLCDKSFNRADTLSLHLNTHSQSQLFHCEQCDRTFSLARYLKRHIARIHNKTQNNTQ